MPWLYPTFFLPLWIPLTSKIYPFRWRRTIAHHHILTQNNLEVLSHFSQVLNKVWVSQHYSYDLENKRFKQWKILKWAQQESDKPSPAAPFWAPISSKSWPSSWIRTVNPLQRRWFKIIQKLSILECYNIAIREKNLICILWFYYVASLSISQSSIQVLDRPLQIQAWDLLCCSLNVGHLEK